MVISGHADEKICKIGHVLRFVNRFNPQAIAAGAAAGTAIGALTAMIPPLLYAGDCRQLRICSRTRRLKT
jgi:hypothetical protein